MKILNNKVRMKKKKKRRTNGIIFCDTMGKELNLSFLYIVLTFSLKIWLDAKILNVSNKGHAPFTPQV